MHNRLIHQVHVSCRVKNTQVAQHHRTETLRPSCERTVKCAKVVGEWCLDGWRDSFVLKEGAHLQTDHNGRVIVMDGVIVEVDGAQVDNVADVAELDELDEQCAFIGQSVNFRLNAPSKMAYGRITQKKIRIGYGQPIQRGMSVKMCASCAAI